jgi:hypothetical protein
LEVRLLDSSSSKFHWHGTWGLAPLAKKSLSSVQGQGNMVESRVYQLYGYIKHGISHLWEEIAFTMILQEGFRKLII